MLGGPSAFGHERGALGMGIGECWNDSHGDLKLIYWILCARRSLPALPLLKSQQVQPTFARASEQAQLPSAHSSNALSLSVSVSLASDLSPSHDRHSSLHRAPAMLPHFFFLYTSSLGLSCFASPAVQIRLSPPLDRSFSAPFACASLFLVLLLC